MRHLLLILVMILAAGCATKGGQVAKDKEKIKAFQGCYAVGFNFVETFPLAEGYKTTAPHHSKALEYVIVDGESDKEVALQHVLVVGKTEKKASLKHWRQEWIYEPSQVLEFKGDNTWEHRNLSSAESQNQWLQRVTQVDDSPRYECAAQWVHTGKDNFWECKSWNPLPRREYTKRSDYQVIERMNRQRLTADGWIHEQDSRKLRLDGAAQVTPIAQERGENTYTRVNDAECKIAADWWQEHKESWKVIRASWDKVRAENSKIHMAFKDPEGDLWKKLFALDTKSHEEKWPIDKLALESETTIKAYLIK